MANGEDNYANIPIPTYEEAISRPVSSRQSRGPTEISDDAERQGLLGAGHAQAEGGTRSTGGGGGRGAARGGYRPATVESARSSMEIRSDADSDLSIPDMTGDQGAQRHVEEMDYLDPEDTSRRSPRLYHRARLRRSKFTQQLSSIGATISSFRLPSFRSLYTSATNPSSSSSGSRFAQIRSQLRIPDQYRVSGANFARLCGLFMIGALVWILFAVEIFPSNMNRIGTMFDPESVRQYVQEHIDPQSIEAYLRHITLFDHVAGSEGDLFLARWMEGRWIEEGNLDDIALLEYFVYLNYPTQDGRSVSIVRPESKKWTAKLEEESAYPGDMERKQTLAWHGHSKNGEVEGPLIYANGGSREDFKWLQEKSITTNGTIALVRYYATQGDRALKIKAAEEAGCIGVLIYSDPSDDGAGKGAVWPDGPWRPADSLQRGGVSLMSWVVGDPLTPGWASTLNAERLSKEDNPGLVNIPSLPLAWRDAEVLLRSISGHGVKVPESWRGYDRNFKDWTTGDQSKDAPIVHLKNLNDESSLQQIWNLHGLIQGMETPEKKILVGNHRDAWCFGGVDPATGSAVLMEVVDIFGQLRKLGWRPLRTIEFVSWDAEEYNLVGSTEYVEDNLDYLRDNGVAYINVDVGVGGKTLHAAGSPLWNRALLQILDRVSDPNSNATLRQSWDERKAQLDGLGAGSDYVAFQDISGTSSIDIGFQADDVVPVYHSCYSTFEYVQSLDPGMGMHRALAQVWALLILEMSDSPLIPYDLRAYAKAINTYIDNLEKDVQIALSSHPEAKLDLTPLRSAAANLTAFTQTFHHFEDFWAPQVLGSGGM